MMQRILLTIVLGLLFAMPWADAKPQAVDAGKSVVQWTGKKLTGQHTGQVKIQSGKVDLDAGVGEIVVDMSTITNDDLSGEWQEKLLTHLKSDDFFAVNQFKTAKLTIKKIEKSGSDYNVSGDLNIKGKSAPVQFKVVPKGEQYDGTLTFDRTQFGITYHSGSLFKNLGDKLIEDQVSLRFSILLK